MIAFLAERRGRRWLCALVVAALGAAGVGEGVARGQSAADIINTSVPLKLTLNELKSRKAQAEKEFGANKQKREAAYKGLSDLHRKLFQVGSSIQAKRLESCGFDASLVSAKLAGDTAHEHELAGKKASADGALKTLGEEFSRVVEAMEKQANEMGKWLLEERRQEALLRTLDERIYIMEVRKLAAGATP